MGRQEGGFSLQRPQCRGAAPAQPTRWAARWARRSGLRLFQNQVRLPVFPPSCSPISEMRRKKDMPNAAIRLPVGMRDYLPAAAAERRGVAEACLQVFERWGYRRLITPLFEY